MLNLGTKYVALLLSLAPAWVQAQWYEGGKPAPDTAYRQHRGGFSVLLAIAPDPDSFMREWFATKESHVPHLREVDRLHRGDRVGALLLFSGCAAEGKPCDAVVDFEVFAPDGSVYGEHANNALWPGGAPKPTVVALSQANLIVRIEPKDPIGTYTVVVDVKSPSSLHAFHLKKSFVVEP